MSLKNLYQKVQSFEASMSPKVMESSVCKKGCSRCCLVDLSIFSLEADHIREWFNNRSDEEKAILRKKWSSPLKEDSDFYNRIQKSCAFLHEGSCTIYEVRPLICRTQGLPMRVLQEKESFVDVCPLNEGMLKEAREKDYLNLDLLNLILSSLERVHAPEGRSRVSLTDLKAELWTQ
jgi:Fe-S-cluster containining protein